MATLAADWGGLPDGIGTEADGLRVIEARPSATATDILLTAAGLGLEEQGDACALGGLRPAARSALARALSTWTTA